MLISAVQLVELREARNCVPEYRFAKAPPPVQELEVGDIVFDLIRARPDVAAQDEYLKRTEHRCGSAKRLLLLIVCGAPGAAIDPSGAAIMRHFTERLFRTELQA